MTCTGCQRENPDDARFCNGCGRPLGQAAQERDPRDYTPRHLAERILTSRSALEGERKQVSVLFADIKGSMDLAERLDPELLHAILDRYFQILAAGVHRHEGTINQYTGDGVMALFGAPLAHEDHAQRACAAALALQAKLAVLSRELRERHGVDLETRMGINSGEVVVGKIGDDLRMDYTAQGHTVGLAHRVEQLARAGRTYLTDATARAVDGYFELRDLGARELKGASRSTRIFELVGRGALRTRLDRSRSLGFSRFVGRDAELAELEDALAAAASGQGRVAALVAEPGTGKSRLAQELVDRARAGGASVREVHALAQTRDHPLGALRELVRSSLGIGASEEPERIRATVRARIGEIEALDPDAAALVCAFLGTPDPQHPLPGLDPDARRRRLLDPLVGIVASPAAAAVGPVLLRVEDLHWVDAASAGVFSAIADRVASARTPGTPTAMLLFTSRPPAQSNPLLDRAEPRIALPLLDPEKADRLAGDWLGEDASVAELGRCVAEAAAGNPLFIEEILRSLLESGELEGERGACRLSVPLTHVTIPDTVQSVLASRIDRLADAEKQVLQAAAVLGRRFETALLGPVVGLERTALAAALETLERNEFLAPVSDSLAREFRHPLTQEVAYQAQLSGRRRETHAAVARALAEEQESGVRDRAGLLAFHHEAAGEAFEAARWYEHAGRRVARSDTDTGMLHCRKACQLLAELPENAETLTLGLTSRIAILEIGRMAGIDAAEAERTFASAREIAGKLGDRPGDAFLLCAYGRLQGLSGDVDGYRALAEQAVQIAAESGDAGLGFEMRAALLHAQIGVGELHAAHELADDLLAQVAAEPALATSASTAPELVRLRAGWVCAYLGRFEQAEPLMRPLGESEAEQLRWDTLYGAWGLRCELARLRGDLPAALEHGRLAVQIAEGLGGTLARVEAGAFFGHAQLDAGQEAAARETLRPALLLARERGSALWYEPRLLALLARVSLALGSQDEARSLAREAVALADAGRGWRVAACDAYLAESRVARAAGEIASARQALDRVAALEVATGAVVYRAAREALASAN